MFGQGRHRNAERVAGGDAALLHRGRSETWKADHVAGGVDMRHLGLEGAAVDRKAPAVVGLEPAVFEPEVIGRADAARRVEQHFGTDAAVIGQVAYGISLVVDLHPVDLGAQPELDAALAEIVHELIDDLAIDEFQKMLARLDDRHRHVERRKDRGVFDAYDARADNRQAPRHVRFGRNIVAVEDVAAVEWNAWWSKRRGPHRDDDLVAGEAVFLG